MRGSGENHSSGSATSGHGKIPSEYPTSSRSGARSPPTASSPDGSASSTGGNTASAPSRYTATPGG